MKLLGVMKMKWETHTGSVHLLGLCSPARSLPEKFGSWVILGEERRVGPSQTLTWIVSRLVRE